MLLKRVQSAEESLPVFAADATGRFQVMVFPLAVTVKSVPVVEVARVTAGPVWSAPAGPIEVTAEVRAQTPFTAKQPEERFTPFAKVEDAAPAMFKEPPTFTLPVMRVEVPAPVTARMDVVAFEVVELVMTEFVTVSFVATKVLAKRFVEVALVVVPEVTVRAAMVEDAFEMKPCKVGRMEKTREPVPVSSVTRLASSDEVSIEVEETLVLKRDQSDAVKQPKVEPLAVAQEREPEVLMRPEPVRSVM